MRSYESDSEDSGSSDVAQTNVLLGYAVKEPDDAPDTFSKLGGRPDFYPSCPPPSFSLFNCGICGGPTLQLLQLNAELPDRFPGHERTLWIMICPSKKCRRKDGCVRAVRGTRVAMGLAKEVHKEGKDKEQNSSSIVADGVVTSIPLQATTSQPDSNKAELGHFLFGGKPGFGGGGGGFQFTSTTDVKGETDLNGTNSNSTQIAEGQEPHSGTLEKSFASVLRLNIDSQDQKNASTESYLPEQEKYLSWPPDNEMPEPFPIFYLDAAYEPDPASVPPPTVPQNKIQMLPVDDANEDPEGSSSGKAHAGYLFESTMDMGFQTFLDRLALEHDQVIRYEFGGTPLLARNVDAVGQIFSTTSDLGSNSRPSLPRCPRCGAGRVFEVQLVPRAIAELEGDNIAVDGMDWSTIIMAVCERDCVLSGEVLPTIVQSNRGESFVGEQNLKDDAWDRDERIVYVNEWVGVQWEELG